MFSAGQTAGLNEAKMKMLALARRVTESQPLQLIQSEPSAQPPLQRTYKEPIQQPGVKRDNKEYFLKCRNKCVDEVAVYTNTLIIRLDKIVNFNDQDDRKRKDFEKQTVPWADDKEAKSCQECGTKFQLYRRRHHCRLCGKIMCHQCSQFMPFVKAKKLTNPEFAAQILNGLAEEDESSDSAPTSDASTSLSAIRQQTGKFFASMLKNDGSENSLSSILQQDVEEHVRMCGNCKGLLDRRDEQMDQATSPPIIVQFYDQLCAMINQVHKLESSYVRMAESLNAGESMYTLENAVELGGKVKSLQSQIDVLSTKIDEFGTKNPNKPPSPSELKLQRFVRLNALHVLSDSPVHRVKIPTPEEFEKLKQRLRKKTQEQVENARTIRNIASSSSLERHRSADGSRPIRANTSFSGHAQTEAGWAPETRIDRNPFTEDESEPLHPVQLQFRIVQMYLKQAAEAGRMSEVESLEQNLQVIGEELKHLKLPLPN
uniref:FYVE-type domain-containing protein n=1 Tax=Steinernema glaseri TaxID=37863 RepID=A0A1I7YS96_9BILA